MNRKLGTLAVGLVLVAAPPLPAAGEARDDDKGTYLGALFGPRPAATPAGTAPAAGVVITHVIPGSPAAQADLRRNDVLLRYDRQPIRDAEHLANLIRADKPDRKVQLLVLRGEKRQTLGVTLTLGPALKLPPAGGRGGGTEAADRPAAKPGAVTLYAAPQPSGKMRLTIEYYSPAGKRQVVTCDDVAAELAATVQKLPQRERDLVRIALERLNKLTSEKGRVRR
jgi:hypothetical protein